MTKEKLIELAKKVAELRAKCITQGMTIEALSKIADDTPEGKAVTEAQLAYAGLSWELGLATEELKSAGVTLYNETGEKKPIEKVEVKIFKELKYDLIKIGEWCRIYAPGLLTVNKILFEKTAVDMKAPVEVTEIPKCTIAQDLSMYLNKKGD